ncbi:positive regulation of cilium movement [Tritrichomonas musculus]|uniref:Positive regulation of cilium movement n=1 Tax=Tritrichomonas musculus TaxID=1915356 RepID=A0ABR2KSI8_9EUKA
MCTIHASIQQRGFPSVKEALCTANIPFSENDDTAILVWLDSLKEGDKVFQRLKPYQVINRIPYMNVLCRKAPLARIIQRITPYFPNLFNFMPKSYILPFKNKQLVRALSRDNCCYIIKPDNGSLGQGITIVEPNTEYEPDDTVSVAQQYIDSFLIDNTKFDLRIYALVTSVNPLTIYVYHGGLARFCSEKFGGDTIYSKLTNVAINHNSQLLDRVFKKMKDEYKIDTDLLWEKIDNSIALTIISSASFIQKGVEWQCSTKNFQNTNNDNIINKYINEINANYVSDNDYNRDAVKDLNNDTINCDTSNFSNRSVIDLQKSIQNDDPKYSYTYSRCFQILGFDILLDKSLNPYVLEVNYRPSLDTHSGEERRMKVDMIRSAILIGAPLHLAQYALSSRKWAWTKESWEEFLENTPEILISAQESLNNAVKNSKYKLVWPSDDPEKKIWKDVYEKAMELPLEQMPGISLPHIIDQPNL